MFTKNQLILLAICAVLTGCATSRTPKMTLAEAERYQVNCAIKDQQIAYLTMFVVDWGSPEAQMNRMTQAVLRRKIDYLYNYCK